jgi:cyanate permease
MMLVGVILAIGFTWVAPGPLFTLIMQDYSIDRATVGLTTSIVSLVMAVSCVLSGTMAGRLGLKKTFAIGSFLVASAVFTPFASNIALLLFFRLIFAIGTAMTFPIASGIVMQWFSPKEIPLINGLNMSMASIGNTVGLFITVFLATGLGWEMSLAVYGFFGLAFAIMWLVWGKDRKPLPSSTGPALPPVTLGSVLKQKTTLLLGLSTMGPFLVFMAISSWLPTYYNEVFGMTLSRASFITVLFTFFGIPAALVGGFLPIRIGLRKPFLVVPGVLIGFAALGTFLVNNLAVIYISIAVFGFCVVVFQPVLITLTMELPGMTPQRAAIVIAMTWAIGNFAGFFGPMIVGFLADATDSYLPGLITCSVLSLSLLAAGLLLPETGPRRKVS